MERGTIMPRIWITAERRGSRYAGCTFICGDKPEDMMYMLWYDKPIRTKYSTPVDGVRWDDSPSAWFCLSSKVSVVLGRLKVWASNHYSYWMCRAALDNMKDGDIWEISYNIPGNIYSDLAFSNITPPKEKEPMLCPHCHKDVDKPPECKTCLKSRHDGSGKDAICIQKDMIKAQKYVQGYDGYGNEIRMVKLAPLCSEVGPCKNYKPSKGY